MTLNIAIRVLKHSLSLNQQVYNEQIRDLLANSPPLAVREDAAKGVVVQGLTLHQVRGRAKSLFNHIYDVNMKISVREACCENVSILLM